MSEYAIVPEKIRFSEEGDPQWFSPRHASEKFKQICLGLAKLAHDADDIEIEVLKDRLWDVQEVAEHYAKYYFCECPIQSVRVMEPSGAIFVILADGREVLVERPD